MPFWASSNPVSVSMPVPEVVRALLAGAQRLRVGECRVRGVRWLLGVDRRWGKRLSSVVVYLDRPVVLQGHLVWFGGALHPVERYVFGR